MAGGQMAQNEVFFKWLPEYSVDIKAIDAQHQELVGILNRLFLAVANHEGDKVIVGILDALTDYTRTHFSLEERLMEQAEYPDLEMHKREHTKFIDQLERLRKKHLVDAKPIYYEMLGFLKTWLKDHIQGVDKKYSIALRKAGFATDAWEQQAAEEFRAMVEKTGCHWTAGRDLTR